MAKKPEPFVWDIEFGSNYPEFRTTHKVEMGEDEEAEFLYYQNLASDLIAAVIVKLGVEFSKYRLDGDVEKLKATTEAMSKAMQSNILD